MCEASNRSRGVASAPRGRLHLLLQVLIQVLPVLAASGEPLLDPRWRTGFRAGIAEGGNVRQADLAAEYRLPWTWSLGRGCTMETALQTAIGGIGDDDHTAAIGPLGLSLRLTYERIQFPWLVAAHPR